MGLELPESVLNQIVEHTKFESMKANPMANYSTLPSSLVDHTVSPFMRKGERKQVLGDCLENLQNAGGGGSVVTF